MSAFPDGWAPGTWRLSGTSLDGGWLPIPVQGDADEVESWVVENTEALRGAWGDGWSEDAEEVVPLLLEASLEHRRPEDFLAFQVWPAPHPVCVFVHVALGVRNADDALPGPGDGILFESEGLGQGVLVPRTEEIGDASVVGYDILFTFADDVVVIVSVEPTFSDLLGFVSPSIQAFVSSLELVDPHDRTRTAEAPALLEARPGNSWVDSLA
ncbi:MAG: hypothetical protein J7484_01745 [Microbacterium sp.]|nr:hypothetical protein [Microbacterium sp.]